MFCKLKCIPFKKFTNNSLNQIWHIMLIKIMWLGKLYHAEDGILIYTTAVSDSEV